MFKVKEAPWKIILVHLLVSMSMTTLINLVLFPGTFFDPVAKATSGLLNILLFSLIIFGWGKLRPADVGLEWHKLAQGVSLTALLWLASQAVVLLINWTSGDVRLDPAWKERAGS